jgi:hypothetical protein
MPKTQKRKVATKSKKRSSRQIKSTPKFSKRSLSLFGIVFALIGGFVLYRAFAATNTVHWWGTLNSSTQTKSWELTTGTGTMGITFSNNTADLTLTVKNSAKVVVGTLKSKGKTDVKLSLPVTADKYTISIAAPSRITSKKGYSIRISYPSKDVVAPTAIISKPLNAETVQGTVDFTAVAQSSNGISKVEFMVDSKIVGTDTTSPYGVRWNTTTVANGQHILSVKSYDTTGLSATASGSVEVKNTVTTPTEPPPPTTSGCVSGSVAAPCIGGPTSGASGWGTPVFVDEFNATALDTNKWAPCWFPGSFKGSDTCGEMNDSVTRKSNVRMEGGAVVLRQSSTQENSASDVGSLINTHPTQVGSGKGFQMGDGHFAEARVHFPGNGTNCYNWPAWWINGPESGFSDGEIDVAEIGGSGVMGTNYHFDRGNGREITQNKISGYWCGGYHVYGVDRRDGQNIIYFDGKQVASYPTYDNGAPQYLIFNVGYKSGKTPATGAASDVRVDYVRVWKK